MATTCTSRPRSGGSAATAPPASPPTPPARGRGRAPPPPPLPPPTRGEGKGGPDPARARQSAGERFCVLRAGGAGGGGRLAAPQKNWMSPPVKGGEVRGAAPAPGAPANK